MTTFNIGKTAKAAAVAVFLGATALTAMPAQAASFSFSFGSPGFNFGIDDDDHHFRPAICLTERQLRRAIRERGYHDIFVNVAIHNRVHVRATRGSWVYQLSVNACSGRILDRERLRRA
jgi:hypothetical protein